LVIALTIIPHVISMLYGYFLSVKYIYKTYKLKYLPSFSLKQQ